MFLNIQTDLIILKTYDQQFTSTTKKSLHIIFKDSERTKSKMLIFCMVLVFAHIFMTFRRYLLDRW